MVVLGFITKENEPKRCTVCFYKKFRHNVKDMIGYTVMEKDIRCEKCEKLCGYWVTGYVEPFYY